MTIESRPAVPEQGAITEASAWFARQRAAPLTEADAAEFAGWLKAHPANTVAWSEFERLWGRVEAVRDDPQILALREEARRRTVRGVGVHRVGVRRVDVRYVGRLAAGLAASVVLGAGMWWGLKERTTAADGERAPAQASATPASMPALMREASTQIGERALLVLTDGSKVTLNTDSAVRADYTGRERRLTLLRGEAFFDVAKNPNRPFIVTAGSRQVIAVGTAFNVRLQNEQVRVTLVEGTVRIVPALAAMVATPDKLREPAVVLQAGSAFVAGADGSERVEQLDTARATSWRSGKLVFDGDRLADVVAEMNRYSREKLEIEDPALEDRKVSGVFEPTDGQAFAKALVAYGIARTSRQSDDATIVLSAP
jgi:transmembrane sensor